MKVLLLIMSTLVGTMCRGQDSTTAVYIEETILKIEGRLAKAIVETRDTTIFDEADSLKKGVYLTVHTEFYTDPESMLLDKVIEKSIYKKTTTELTIYFLGNQPIRFTNRQWQGSTLIVDFDIYYMNDNTVYVTKRNNLKGLPDGDMFLKWCYQLREQYMTIVQEYNETFVKAKAKSRKT